MARRFKDFDWVRLKPDVPRDSAPWPKDGQCLRIISVAVEEGNPKHPALYLCEWASIKPGTQHRRPFRDNQLDPWPQQQA